MAFSKFLSRSQVDSVLLFSLNHRNFFCKTTNGNFLKRFCCIWCGVSRGGSGGTASFSFFLPIIFLSRFQVLGHLFVLEPALKGTALGRSMADWSTASNLKWNDQWQAASTYPPLGRDNGSAIWQHSQYLTQKIGLLGQQTALFYFHIFKNQKMSICKERQVGSEANLKKPRTKNHVAMPSTQPLPTALQTFSTAAEFVASLMSVRLSGNWRKVLRSGWASGSQSGLTLESHGIAMSNSGTQNQEPKTFQPKT